MSIGLEIESRCDKPGCKVKNIQEGSKRIAGHVADLRLVHECLVEEVGGVLFLHLFLVFLLTIGTFGALCLLLLHCCARNVESHFNELIGSCSGLAAPVLCAASRLAIAVRISAREGKLHRHLVLSGQVGIGDFGVGDLEGGSVLDVERQLGLGEFCLAPVPSSQGVFAGLDIDAIPDFESLAQPLEILDAQVVSQ